jgi:peptidoglycan/xylan/chitin deacetylase (PgdA/CDA1 family)
VVRVDEYPLAGAFGSGNLRLERGLQRFHATLADAGVPYLMAVTPEVSREYLNPVGTRARYLSEVELTQLHRLVADGVELGLHGFDHRTRDAHPRQHSEGPDSRPGR